MNISGSIRLNPKGIGFLIIGLSTLYAVYMWNRSSHDSENVVPSQSNSEHISLGELLCTAIQAAEAGGRQVKLVRERSDVELNEKSKGKTKEGVKDVLTDGDLRSHQLMFGTLTKAFPSIKIISEEHDDTANPLKPEDSVKECPALQQASKNEWVPSESITVWIDPLDATKEYTENLLDYVTTMVCVAVNGEPVIGVIHKPFEEVTYWGWVHNGISEELKAINDTPEADRESFIISLSHTGSTVEQHIKSSFQDAKIEKAGGAGYKSLQVAGHKAGAYVHMTNIKKWDVCSGHAIINSLGGSLTSMKNEKITYRASDPVLIEGGLLATLNVDNFYSKLLS